MPSLHKLLFIVERPLDISAGHHVDLQLPSPVQLTAWCPCQPVAYPDRPPLVAVTCGDLEPSQLLTLTAKLATAAAGLTGDPMIHELAVQLGEALEQLLGEATTTSSAGSSAAPPPYDAPAASDDTVALTGQSAVDYAEDKRDGYTTAAQQHADVAEAIIGRNADDDGSSTGSSVISSRSSSTWDSSSSSSRSVSTSAKRKRQTSLSPQQQAAESKRLQDLFKHIEVG